MENFVFGAAAGFVYGYLFCLLIYSLCSSGESEETARLLKENKDASDRLKATIDRDALTIPDIQDAARRNPSLFQTSGYRH